jgi:hypothetical protein
LFILKIINGPKGISTHIFDWLDLKRYKVLPGWHLGKGNEKEGFTAPHKTLFLSRREGRRRLEATPFTG